MPTLKNRNSSIPNGLSFVQPQLNWNSKTALYSHPSLSALVGAVVNLRRGNPHVAMKHRLSVDAKVVEEEIVQYNAQVCLSHGWLDYITQDAVNFPKSLPPRRFSNGLAAAGGRVRKAVAGVKIYADWLGDGLKPVPADQSEKRAAVCAACKENQDPDWLQKFEATVANKIKQVIAIREDLDLKTSFDAKLNSCQVCDCPIKEKVDVPIKHILKNTSEKTMAALRVVNPPCWIVTEAKA